MANEDFDDTIELASQVKSYQKTTKDGKVVTVRGYTRVNTDNSAVTERATRKPGRPRIAASTGRFPGDRSTPVFPDAGKTVSNPGEKKVEYKDLPDTGVVDQAALDREVPVALAVLENQPSNPALKKLKSILSSLSTASLTTDVAFDPDVVELARGIVRVSGYTYVSPKTGKIIRVNPYTQLRSLVSALGGPMMAAKSGITADLLDAALPGYNVKKKVFEEVTPDGAPKMSASQVAEKLNNISLPREFDLPAPKTGEKYMANAMKPTHPLEAVRKGGEGSLVTKGSDTWARGMDGLWYKTPRKNVKGIDDTELTRRLARGGGTISFTPSDPMKRTAYPQSKVDYSNIKEGTASTLTEMKYMKAFEPVFRNLPDGIADTLNSSIAIQTNPRGKDRSYPNMTKTHTSRGNDFLPLLRMNVDKDYEADLMKNLPKQQEWGYSAPTILHPTEYMATRATADWFTSLMNNRGTAEMTDRMYRRLNAAYDKHVKDTGSFEGLPGKDGWVARMKGKRPQETTNSITSQLSLSATNSPEDFLAEAWVEFVGNPSPRPLAQDMGKALQASMEEFSDYLFKNKWVDASEIPPRVYNSKKNKTISRKVSDAIGGFEDFTSEENTAPRDLRDVINSSSKYVDVRDADGNPTFDMSVQQEGASARIGSLSLPMTDPDDMLDGVPYHLTQVMVVDTARYYNHPEDSLQGGEANQRHFADAVDMEKSLAAISAVEEVLASEGVQQIEVSTSAHQDSLVYARAGYSFHPVSTDVADIADVLNNIQSALDNSAWKSKEDKGFWELPKDVRQKTQRKLNEMQQRLYADPETWPTPAEIADLGKYSVTERSLGEAALNDLSWDGIKTKDKAAYRDVYSETLTASRLNTSIRDYNAGNVTDSVQNLVEAALPADVQATVSEVDGDLDEKSPRGTNVTLTLGDMPLFQFTIEKRGDETFLTTRNPREGKDDEVAIGATALFEFSDALSSMLAGSDASKLHLISDEDGTEYNFAASGFDWVTPPPVNTLRSQLNKARDLQVEATRAQLKTSLANKADSLSIEEVTNAERNIDRYVDDVRANLTLQVNALVERHKETLSSGGIHPFEVSQLGKKEAFEANRLIGVVSPQAERPTATRLGDDLDTPDTNARTVDTPRVPSTPDVSRPRDDDDSIQVDNPLDETHGFIDEEEDPIEEHGMFAEMFNYDGDYERDARIEFMAKQALTLGGYEWYRTMQGFWEWSVQDSNARRATVGLLYLLLRLLPASVGRGAALSVVNTITKKVRSQFPEDRPSPQEIQAVVEDLMKQIPPEDLPDLGALPK